MRSILHQYILVIFFFKKAYCIVETLLASPLPRSQHTPNTGQQKLAVRRSRIDVRRDVLRSGNLRTCQDRAILAAVAISPGVVGASVRGLRQLGASGGDGQDTGG